MQAGLAVLEGSSSRTIQDPRWKSVPLGQATDSKSVQETGKEVPSVRPYRAGLELAIAQRLHPQES